MANPTGYTLVINPSADDLRISAIQGDSANLRVSSVQGNSFSNIAVSAQTTVKSAAGFLHAIAVNAQNVSAIRLYDNTVSGGTTIATLPASAQTNGPFYPFDLNFATGLTISTGSSNTDITVMYQ